MPAGLKGLGGEGDPNTQSDLDIPEEKISTFCSHFKMKAAALFSNFHRISFCGCDRSSHLVHCVDKITYLKKREGAA